MSEPQDSEYMDCRACNGDGCDACDWWGFVPATTTQEAADARAV